MEFNSKGVKMETLKQRDTVAVIMESDVSFLRLISKRTEMESRIKSNFPQTSSRLRKWRLHCSLYLDTKESNEESRSDSKRNIIPICTFIVDQSLKSLIHKNI